jgi:hypothetical protein
MRLDPLDIRATGRNLATIRSPGGRITALPVRAVAATAAAPVMVVRTAVLATAGSLATLGMAVCMAALATAVSTAAPVMAVSMAALAV